MNEIVRRFYEFGPFRIDAEKRVLLHDGEVVPLTPKAFDTLLVLVEHHGQVLRKDELMQMLWPDSNVEESNLPLHISALRKALGESPNERRFIITVPGKGYRFAADLKEADDNPSDVIVGRYSKSTIVIQDQGRGQGLGQKSKGLLTAFGSFTARQKLVFAGIALAIVLIGVTALYYFWPLSISTVSTAPDSSTPNDSSSPVRSIAVLPFELLGAAQNSEAEYLSDGMSESLINSLSQLPNMKVIARSSSFKYKGEDVDPQEAAKALGVEMILTGRLWQRGEQLQISVELMNAHDKTQVWGEQYDRKLKDLLAWQGEIARDVSNKLRVKLSGEEENRLVKNYTENAEAYLLYLKARYYWNRRRDKDFEKAIEACQQAIAIDPNYALAYAGLADAYTYPPLGTSPRERMLKAREAALKALSLDDNLAEAHSALGRVLAFYDYDLAGAEREHRRAIERSPNNAIAQHRYGEVLGLLGRTQEFSNGFLRSLELEPLSLVFNSNYGLFLIFARRYDDAIAQLKKTLELDERFALAHGHLSLAYQLTGNYAESVEERAKAIEVSGDYQSAALARGSFGKGGWEEFLRYMARESRALYRPAYLTAIYHAALGEKDKAIAALNKSYENREQAVALLKVDPRLDPLRSDSRFQDLLARVGLSQ